MSKISRRRFLQFTTGLTATQLSAKVDSAAKTLEIKESDIEIQAFHPSGEPLQVDILKRLYFLNLNDEPLPNTPRRVETGQIFSQPPSSPFAIALRMPVEGFGEVTLYADNQGKGYQPKDFPLQLNLALASSRLHRVRHAMSSWSQNGIEFSTKIKERLQKASALLQAAEETSVPQLRAWLCNRVLFESLWAGEQAVFTKAQQEIKRQPARPDFLFGCNFFNFQRKGIDSSYNQLFKQLFNFATVPFYWRSFEPQPNLKQYDRVDRMVNWLRRWGITPKGHPLVYFHRAGVPDWLEGKSYSQVQQLIYRSVSEITAHYGERIPYYDIINEANGLSWANTLGYSLEQLLEIANLAATASRAGNPQVQRIINHCCLWATRMASPQPPLTSPYQFLKSCLAAEIPFELIGLQLYYPRQDMFEINRLLERFSQLGKPIHITELGVSSAPGKDERSILKGPIGLWHSSWSESVQADWVEQFYTLCYSKPYIQAITWWDFADIGHFWPYGGLLDANLQPKLSFWRLTRLIQQWRSHNSPLQ